MRRVLAATAIMMTIGATGMAGMGISTRRWKELRTDGRFLGVFRDYRGARAAFFVEDKTGLVVGPLDLDTPSGPGWALKPAPEPRDLHPGDHATVVYAAIVQADRPFGHPPADDLSKTRADRHDGDPLDGMLVSVEKRPPAPPAPPTETRDPLGLALQGQMPPLKTEDDRRKAAVGFLLKRDAARFQAAKPPADLARLGALVLGGLPALEGPLAPAARLWRAGQIAETRALLKRSKDDLHFWLGTDRWRRPPHPMESSPGEPLPGPFLRWEEYSDADPLSLHYVAPDFVKLVAAELGWHERPF